MKGSGKSHTSGAGNVLHFNLVGLTIFALSLLAASALLTYVLTGRHRAAGDDAATGSGSQRPNGTPPSLDTISHSGPWGELQMRDMELERPEEYLTGELTDPPVEKWVFNGMKPEAVRALLSSIWPATAQTNSTPAECFTETDSGTEFKPSEQFLFSLDAGSRQKLYLALAGKGVNSYYDAPFVFPEKSIQSLYADPRLQPDDVVLLKRLVFQNGAASQLTDFETLARAIPTLERRVAMAQVLSRQTAVLPRLNIHPNSDIDKIASYWGHMPNVRFTDIRPLLQSLKSSSPDGGSISLVFLLPPFARERLYTFPLPPQAGDPIMDCHWSTFNFFRTTPDNRFNDPPYAAQFIQNNYYQIGAPSLYGDIVLLMNDKKEAKHSAVYLADDLVFTKNGNNYRQPWMIMHLCDLQACYPATPPLKLVCLRRKSD